MCVYCLFSESRLLSVNNLNETDLCNESKISVLTFLSVNLGANTVYEDMWICKSYVFVYVPV